MSPKRADIEFIDMRRLDGWDRGHESIYLSDPPMNLLYGVITREAQP